MSTQRIRSDVLSSLRELLPAQTVRNWFESAKWQMEEEQNILHLTVPHSFHRSQIRDRCHSALLPACREVLGEGVDIQIRVDKDFEYSETSTSSDETESSDESTNLLCDRKMKKNVVQGTRSVEGECSSVVAPANGHEGGSQKRNRQAGPNGSDRSPTPQATRSTSSHNVHTAASTDPQKAQSETIQRSAAPSEELHRSRVGELLKDRYTFAAFVEGDSNALARSAAMAVATNPGGTEFNPLLIYGGVGLGKTHLAQAIANRAADEGTAEYICYESSEAFTSHFVQAIRDGDGGRFSRQYRGVDLLILDDVQFFSGKEKTQEEFFHLFNALHQRGKQIVLCADRPPKEIDGIEERLLSRFDWGLSADVQQPTFETRLAILHRKAKTLGLDIEDDVLVLMAQSITQNIRQLEGALKQISARAELIDAEVDVPAARKLLEGQVDLSGPSPPEPEEIINAVVSYYGVSHEDVVNRSRKKAVVRPRHVAMYLCRSLTNKSLSSIGARFAGRDHSTVSHACTKIQDLLDVERDLKREVEELKRKIQGAVSQS